MLVLSFPIGRLECSFHLSILFIIIRIMIRAAKIEPFFEYTKSRLPFFPFFRGGALAHSYVDIYNNRYKAGFFPVESQAFCVAKLRFPEDAGW